MLKALAHGSIDSLPALQPFGTLCRAPLARATPCGQNRLGDLERRMRPAEPLTGSCDFFRAKGRAVRRRRALLLRRTVADHRLAGDEPRLAVVRAGAGNGSRDRKRIVTIDGCGVPSGRLEAADLILRRRKRSRPVD